MRDRDVLIAVTDTGPGIPHHELEAIFEPYRSIKRRSESGTGLGLYITKGIVASSQRRRNTITAVDGKPLPPRGEFPSRRLVRR